MKAESIEFIAPPPAVGFRVYDANNFYVAKCATPCRWGQVATKDALGINTLELLIELHEQLVHDIPPGKPYGD